MSGSRSKTSGSTPSKRVRKKIPGTWDRDGYNWPKGEPLPGVGWRVWVEGTNRNKDKREKILVSISLLRRDVEPRWNRRMSKDGVPQFDPVEYWVVDKTLTLEWTGVGWGRLKGPERGQFEANEGFPSLREGMEWVREWGWWNGERGPQAFRHWVMDRVSEEWIGGWFVEGELPI